MTGMIYFQPARRGLMAGKLRCDFKYSQLLATLANLDLVANTHLERRNVHLAAIHFHVAMAHDLPRLAP